MLRLYQEVLRRQPDNLRLRYRFAVRLREIQNYDDALEQLSGVIKQNPDFVDAHQLMGLLYGQLGKAELAASAFQEVLTRQPHHQEALFGLGLVLSELNRTEEAAAQYEKLLGIAPEHAGAHYRLALLLRDSGQHEEAVRHLKQVLSARGPTAMAHHELGVTLLQLQRPAEGVAHFEKAIQINPRLLGSVNNLAWIRATCPDAGLRDGQQAVELAEHACEATNFQNVSLLDTLAAAYAEVGRFDQAVEMITNAINLVQKSNRVSQLPSLQTRQQLYQNHQPYRDVASTSDDS